jgi:hypothetical protein
MKLKEINVFPSELGQLVQTPVPGIATWRNVFDWSERYAFATITGTKNELERFIILNLATLSGQGYIEAPVTEDLIKQLEDSDTLVDKDWAIERLRLVLIE